MGLHLKIEGNETISLRETSIMSVQFGADIPHDSNARSTDLGSTVLITGRSWRPWMEKPRMIPARLLDGRWCRQRMRTVTGMS